jgi:hypothetical protein
MRKEDVDGKPISAIYHLTSALYCHDSNNKIAVS